MLADRSMLYKCQRQHLKGPDSHTVEVVAAGNNCNNIVAQNGLLQELRIRLGQPTPLYLDSKTKVVALNDTAVKKSIWLTRRVAVLQDASCQNEILPIHMIERDWLLIRSPSISHTQCGIVTSASHGVSAEPSSRVIPCTAYAVGGVSECRGHSLMLSRHALDQSS